MYVPKVGQGTAELQPAAAGVGPRRFEKQAGLGERAGDSESVWVMDAHGCAAELPGTTTSFAFSLPNGYECTSHSALIEAGE